MSDTPTDGAIAVFTGKGVDTLLRDRGSGSWLLNAEHARRQPYLVCVRNKQRAEPDAPEPHGSAFLIGKVSDLQRLPPVRGIDRWRIAMSEYALVADGGDVWQGRRNPVRYTTLDELGIVSTELSFQPVPTTTAGKTETSDGIGKLTIPQAKAGLALTLGISPDAIEIIIKG